MSTFISIDSKSGSRSECQVDPVSISARLLNLILEMPVERQLALLDLLDNCRYDGARKHPRKKLAIPVDLEFENSTTKEATRDISRGGLYIETRTTFTLNQEVNLNFQLPHQSKPIKVVGEIVRATPQGIGIKFKRYSNR